MTTIQRNIGIDLLRILSMFMIVLEHIIGGGGAIAIPAGSIGHAILWLIETICFCAVNCFAMISGFVGVHSSFKLSRLIYIWFEIVFYSILIWGISFMFEPEPLSISTVFAVFLPIITNQYWYLTAYFGLFFLMPILNITMKAMSRQSFFLFLCVIFGVFCILPSLFHSLSFGLDGGYSMIWLAILYMLGAYTGLYGDLLFKSKKSAAIVLICSILFVWTFRVVVDNVTLRMWGESHGGGWFMTYTSPFILINALALLSLFKDVKPNCFNNVKLCNLIKTISISTLGVYIIHQNAFINEHIIHGSSEFFLNSPSLWGIILVLLIAIGVFIICSFIDIVRSKLFSFLRVDALSSRLGLFITSNVKLIYCNYFEKG